MPEISESVDVDAPPERVWTALTDWTTQGRWILATDVRPVVGPARGVGGRLVAVTGWTHDFDSARLTDEYPIGLHRSPEGFKSLESFSLRAGGRTYPLERKLRERIRPDRVNTVLIAPRSKVLINVLPA